MDVGLGLWTLRSTASIPGSFPAMHAELAADARRVEKLGFHSLWVAEHHFWYDGWTPAPLVTAAAALSATRRLHVGTGIHLLPMADPAAVAREIEWLHRMSGGRFEYGVGLGYRAAEYDGFGLSRRDRGRRMDAALDYLLGRWSGTDAPRIWVGGFAEAAVHRTASRGLGALLPSTMLPHQVQRAIAQFHDAAAHAGGLPGKIAMMKYTWLVDSERERRRAQAVHEAITGEYTGAWFELQGRPAFESPELMAAQIQRALDTALIGGEDEVVEKVHELRKAGVEMVVMHLIGDARAPGSAEMIERLAETVLPSVSGASA